MRSSKFFTYFLLSVFIVMLTIVFVFWGIGPYDNPDHLILAEVEGKKITEKEFWRTYNRFYDSVKQNIKDEEEFNKLNFKKKVLNDMINHKVLLVIAEKEGILVTEKELTDAIKKEQIFQKDGVFDKTIYTRFLELNRLTPETYESMVMQDMAWKKLYSLIGDMAELSDEELKNLTKEKKNEEQLKNFLLSMKKNRMLNIYLESVKRQMDIKIHNNVYERI